MLKILAERRSTNLHLWSLLQTDIAGLLKENTNIFTLKELSQILDCYYKCAIANREHNQSLATSLMKIPKEDFLQELSVNEVLRLFRGLFLMDAIPNSVQYSSVFNTYH